jgi:6-phosphogluconate dehydrogenase
MRIGLIGLGKMGSHMVPRLVQRDHQVVAYDLDKDAVREAERKGAEGAGSLVASRAEMAW